MERFKLDADSLFFSVSENAATINGNLKKKYFSKP